jgi:transcription initiation factor TFIID subunit 4
MTRKYLNMWQTWQFHIDVWKCVKSNHDIEFEANPSLENFSIILKFLFQVPQQAQFENVKKCKNFLTTLIKLASSQPKKTVDNVKALIQGLIVSKIVLTTFTLSSWTKII